MWWSPRLLRSWWWETGLIPLDLDGRRYYVREGHYYLREIDGRYTEVPPPAALR